MLISSNQIACVFQVPKKNRMDTITNNPGLEHIAEKILMHLKVRDALKCRLTNKTWQLIVDHSKLLTKWLIKSSKNQEFWKKIANYISKIKNYPEAACSSYRLGSFVNRMVLSLLLKFWQFL